MYVNQCCNVESLDTQSVVDIILEEVITTTCCVQSMSTKTVHVCINSWLSTYRL